MLTVHIAVLTGEPFNQNAQFVAVVIVNCAGKYTRISKLLVNAVIALKLNEYNDDCDFA